MIEIASVWDSPVLIAIATTTIPLLVGQWLQARRTRTTTEVSTKRVGEKVEEVRVQGKEIHTLVNGQKAELERQNAVLRAILQQAGLPVPIDLIAAVLPPVTQPAEIPK